MTKKGSKVSIANPIFPIRLNNKDGAYLLGLMVSDGCIYFDKVARNQIRTKYAAGEVESEELFRSTIKRLYGDVHIQREYIRNSASLRIGSSIVGDSLLRVGAISGTVFTYEQVVRNCQFGKSHRVQLGDLSRVK